MKLLSNLFGFSTSRKIVVLESDDWGSIRMPSNETRVYLEKKGLDLEKGKSGYRYNLYDTLASAEDLEALFNTLGGFRDKNHKSPVFTAVSLVANPDFARIKSAGYCEYFYEPFPETLVRYKKEDALNLWKQGKKECLFQPEFHGREHLNVSVWLRALQNGDPETLLAFERSFWGFKNKNKEGIKYQAAFALNDINDLAFQEEVIKDGLQIFENIHEQKAVFFVPPNGPFNSSLEGVAAQGGIRYISTAKMFRDELGSGKSRKVFRWLGMKNKHGQRYLTRNCFFEPSDTSKDWVDSCLKEIEIAFLMRKPAVISSHRVNYIGALDERNRKRGLSKLTDLIQTILKRWPQTEFMTSKELGELIAKP